MHIGEETEWKRKKLPMSMRYFTYMTIHMHDIKDEGKKLKGP